MKILIKFAWISYILAVMIIAYVPLAFYNGSKCGESSGACSLVPQFYLFISFILMLLSFITSFIGYRLQRKHGGNSRLVVIVIFLSLLTMPTIWLFSSLGFINIHPNW